MHKATIHISTSADLSTFEMQTVRAVALLAVENVTLRDQVRQINARRSYGPNPLPRPPLQDIDAERLNAGVRAFMADAFPDYRIMVSIETEADDESSR